MTLDELKLDLISKIDDKGMYDDIHYFNKKLFPEEDVVPYCRRSFDDLMKYYGPLGVTEDMLIKALDVLQFVCYVCGDLRQVVFFRYADIRQTPGKTKKMFWDDGHEDSDVKENVYLPSQIEEIYDRVCN